MSNVPFWDPGAYPAVSTRDPKTGVTSTGSQPAQGIVAFPASEDPTMPWPDELSLWETIYFNGQRAPGLCRVRGGRRRRLDSKTAFGSSGSAVTSGGYEPAEFQITLRLWSAVHFSRWCALVNVLFPRATLPQPTGLAPQQTGFVATIGPQQPPIPLASTPADVSISAVKVMHPAFQSIGVNDVYVEDIRVPEHIGNLIFEVTIDVTELALPVGEGVKQFKFATAENANGTTLFKTLPADPSVTSINP